MRYIAMLVCVVGCADKAALDAVKQENAALRSRVEKLEAQLTELTKPAAKEKPSPSEFDPPTALLRTIDHYIGEFDRDVGMSYEQFLDDHGRVADLGLIATKLRDKLTKANGEEGAWRILSNWMGLPLAVAIMKGKIKDGHSVEDPPDRKAHLARMEELLLSDKPGNTAINLGFKLTEELDDDGHLRDPAAMCHRIAKWYKNKGSYAHGALLTQFGRTVGSEIWSGWLCDETK